MELSSSLVTQFVKATRDTNKNKSETTVYGTVSIVDDKTYVKLDGSDLLTPASNLTNVKDGERVAVLIKDHTATVTGNIDSPSARGGDVDDMGDALRGEFNEIVADRVKAEIGEFDEIYAEKAEIGELVAEHIKANIGEFDELYVGKGEFDEFKADTGEFGKLSADVAEIETLIFDSATGKVVHSSFSDAVVAQITEAQIKSAMIESVSADKILAGSIFTNNVNVQSEDGRLLIADETIQISDENIVRVQIGKDAANDYSISIWDANGNLMFSEGGITDSAIKNAIIRNDMVRDDANISAGKLDIQSLFKEINDSSETIISSKIKLDGEAGTLDVVLKDMTSTQDAHGRTLESHGSSIQATTDFINSKVWEQYTDTAVKDLNGLPEEIDTLKTNYSELNQGVDDITARVQSTESQIARTKIGARNLLRNSTNLLFEDYYFVSDKPDNAMLGSATLDTMILDKEG